jgi:hypothetical protein
MKQLSKMIGVPAWRLLCLGGRRSALIQIS